MRLFSDPSEFPEDMLPKKPKAPIWLDIYLQVKRYNQLPWEGALMDQPMVQWNCIVTAGEAYESWLNSLEQEQRLGERNYARLQESMGRR